MGRVTVSLTGDASKLLRELRKVERAQGDLGRAAEQASTTGTLAAQAMAGAVGALAAASASALSNVRSLNDALAETQRQAAATQAPLAQLSGGDPAMTRELLTQSRVLAGLGVQNADAALFNLQSAGLNTAQTRQFLVDLSASGLVGQSPDEFIKQAGAIQAGFGAAEAGGTGSVVSKVLLAAAGSKTDASELALAASGVSGVLGAAGVSDEDVLASLAVQGKSVSVGQAATDLQALVSTVNIRDSEGRAALAAGGLPGLLRNLESRGLADQEAFAGVFGRRKEAYQGFARNLAGIGDIEGLSADLGGVTSGAPGLALARANISPAARADLRRRQEEQQYLIQEDARATRENLTKAELMRAQRIAAGRYGPLGEAAFRALPTETALDLAGPGTKEALISGGTPGISPLDLANPVGLGAKLLGIGQSEGDPAALAPIREAEGISGEAMRRIRAGGPGAGVIQGNIAGTLVPAALNFGQRLFSGGLRGMFPGGMAGDAAAAAVRTGGELGVRDLLDGDADVRPRRVSGKFQEAHLSPMEFARLDVTTHRLRRSHAAAKAWEAARAKEADEGLGMGDIVQPDGSIVTHGAAFRRQGQVGAAALLAQTRKGQRISAGEILADAGGEVKMDVTLLSKIADNTRREPAATLADPDER